jgi:hypothetical protein
MKIISFEEYNEWSENHAGIISEDGFFDDEDVFEEEGVQFHIGNLSVNSLDVSPCVVVDGDLEIAEDITYQFERGLLVVNGNLKCKNFSFPFPTVVTGNIYADSIHVDSGCDYWLTVGGDIHAKSVIEDGHCIKVLGEIHSPIIKSFVNELTIGGKKIERSDRD